MPDTSNAESILSAAERAAEAGDLPKTEALLRQAAELQETVLGPEHPDLANTLNNLAIVCERTEKPADAERHYRRAAQIAAVALEPDHPFVTTSRENLRAFCEARGIPFDAPTPEPKTPPAPTPAPMLETPDPTPASTEPKTQPSATSTTPAATVVTVALLAVVLIAVAIRFWPDSSASAPPATPAADPTPITQTPAEQPPAAAPTTPVPEPEPPPEPAAPPPAAPAAVPPTATSGDQPEVAEAELCLSLSTSGAQWECERLDSSTSPGRRVFYTRIRTAQDTTVEHRWYRGAQLIQSVELRILTNLGAGYRTYSQYTFGRDNTGDFRVELRSSDGVLLHEERFVVR